MARAKTLERISLPAARAIALAAAGLDRPRPDNPGRPHVLKAIARLGLLQIDAVNVLARAHYLPLFSRLGAYDPVLLNEAWFGRRRALFEYWAHEASLLPLASYPSFRWRMEAAAAGEGIYGGLARFARENKPYLDAVRAELADRGPLGASELSQAGARRGGWWGWSEGKRAMEFLFWSGEVTAASRRGFERLYDFTHRVFPDLAAAPAPEKAQAQRDLLAHAATALGVATAGDLRDYFRLPAEDMKARLAELVEAGALVPVRVEGWSQQAYLHPGAKTPRALNARALIAPFDPLIWERARTQRLFGFDYRIEIYVPKEKRRYGYYVLPFLMGDRFVARLDLKADRQGRALLVQGAFLEEGEKAGPVAEALSGELRLMARWLGLDGVNILCARALSKALKPLTR